MRAVLRLSILNYLLRRVSRVFYETFTKLKGMVATKIFENSQVRSGVPSAAHSDTETSVALVSRDRYKRGRRQSRLEPLIYSVGNKIYHSIMERESQCKLGSGTLQNYVPFHLIESINSIQRRPKHPHRTGKLLYALTHWHTEIEQAKTINRSLLGRLIITIYLLIVNTARVCQFGTFGIQIGHVRSFAGLVRSRVSGVLRARKSRARFSAGVLASPALHGHKVMLLSAKSLVSPPPH